MLTIWYIYAWWHSHLIALPTSLYSAWCAGPVQLCVSLAPKPGVITEQCAFTHPLSILFLVCNWGQEWEVDKINTETQYRANIPNFIHADVGIKIGLRNVNITLKSKPVL